MMLDADGISKVVEDYMMLRDYHLCASNKWLNNVYKRFGPSFLTKADRKALSDLISTKTTKEEIDEWLFPRVKPRIKPFVYFTYSLCRYLQEHENPLTAVEAYWLGVVDEVIGSDLPCMRQIMENQDEIPPQTPELAEGIG